MKRVDAKKPRGADEWQECVDACHAALLLDSMYQYGLITPEPKLNLPRCQWLLNVGKYKGFIPNEENVLKILADIITHEHQDVQR
jgi:hypothetical protein